MADDEPAATAPHTSMIISVRTRYDVVVMDPDKFLAAARRACRVLNPELTDDDLLVAVADVYDAVDALIECYGSVASDHPEVAGGTQRRRMHGGVGLLPGDRIADRADGLSPAGSITVIELDEPLPLQDYGCALPDPAGLFGNPGRRAPG